MNTTRTAVRLFAAATAFAVTMFLLSTVFAIAEPQRSVLLAKIERQDKAAAGVTTLAMAVPGGAKVRR